MLTVVVVLCFNKSSSLLVDGLIYLSNKKVNDDTSDLYKSFFPGNIRRLRSTPEQPRHPVELHEVGQPKALVPHRRLRRRPLSTRTLETPEASPFPPEGQPAGGFGQKLSGRHVRSQFPEAEQTGTELPLTRMMKMATNGGGDDVGRDDDVN